jgi:hypothetical protein
MGQLIRRLPRSLHQVMRLRHKLIDVVIVTVVYAVDVSQPTVPACPLPIAYAASAKHATLTPSVNRP